MRRPEPHRRHKRTSRSPHPGGTRSTGNRPKTLRFPLCRRRWGPPASEARRRARAACTEALIPARRTSQCPTPRPARRRGGPQASPRTACSSKRCSGCSHRRWPRSRTTRCRRHLWTRTTGRQGRRPQAPSARRTRSRRRPRRPSTSRRGPAPHPSPCCEARVTMAPLPTGAKRQGHVRSRATPGRPAARPRRCPLSARAARFRGPRSHGPWPRARAPTTRATGRADCAAARPAVAMRVDGPRRPRRDLGREAPSIGRATGRRQPCASRDRVVRTCGPGRTALRRRRASSWHRPSATIAAGSSNRVERTELARSYTEPSRSGLNGVQDAPRPIDTALSRRRQRIVQGSGGHASPE